MSQSEHSGRHPHSPQHDSHAGIKVSHTTDAENGAATAVADAPAKVDGSKSIDTKLGELKNVYDAANESLKNVISRKQETRIRLKAQPESAEIKAEYDKLKADHTAALVNIRAARGAYKDYRATVVGAPATPAAAAPVE